MFVIGTHRSRWLYWLVPVCCVVTIWLLPPIAMAQHELVAVRIVRTIEPVEIGSWRPTALTFASEHAEFWLINMPRPNTTGTPALIRLNRFDEIMDSYPLPAAVIPQAITYDSKSGEGFLLDTIHNQLLAFALVERRMENGAVTTISITAQYALDTWGTTRPQALAIDTQKRLLYLLDTGHQQLLALQLEPARTVLTEVGSPVVTDLPMSSNSTLSHLALDPVTGNLLSLEVNQLLLYEFSPLGALIETYDLAELGVKQPQGFVFAPSSDRTDDPNIIHMFMTDSGQAEFGRLVELSLVPVEVPIVAAGVNRATLVRTIDTGAFAYPSPDPSGLAYISDSPFVKNTKRLLIVDGEVEETPLYRGANVFEVDLSGKLVQTYTTHLVFSSEPVGAAFNAANGHLFISDDDKRRIHEIDPGPDKEFMTADDTRSSMLISTFGGIDAEGVAFGLVNGTTPMLFMADGVNNEIYRITPGPDGLFGGAAPDDVITSFDTAIWDVVDPEGIEYNPANGHLYVAGAQLLPGRPSRRIAEFTLTGLLVQYIDISAANPIKPAGLALAPSSQNPEEMALYIVDRGIDNNVVIDENDGKLYEFALPATNQPPTVDAGADQTTIAQQSIILQGIITDDGLPVLPTTMTVLWEKVSGPGTVTFSQAKQALTTATFDAAGIYTLRLTANDGEFQRTDEVIVTVTAANTPPVVNAGSDQSVTLAAGAELAGVVSDDGLPNPPGKVTVEWQQVSGPDTARLSNRTQVKTKVTFPTIGVYVLRLTATDGALTADDEVVITVKPANQAPIVELTPTRIVTLTQLTETIGITATVSDDDDPKQLTINWSVISGSGEVTFGNANHATTTVQFSQAGDYLLQVTVSNSEYTTTKTTMITVMVKADEIAPQGKLFVPLVWR